jgi:hypothetical protein
MKPNKQVERKDRLEVLFEKMKQEPEIYIHVTEIIKRCLEDGFVQLGKFKICNDAVEGTPIFVNPIFELRWRSDQFKGERIEDLTPLGGELNAEIN